MKANITLMVIVLVTLMACASSKHILERGSSFSADELEEDNLVEVVQTAEGLAGSKATKHYYIVRVDRKDKKDAYNTIKKVFDKVISILTKNNIIPNEGSLVKSKIKPQYQSKKRRWFFSTIFVVLGTQKELELTFKQLTQIGVQRLQARPSINFLNEKLLAMELFNSAKAQLVALLQPIDYEIKEVERIEIQGREMENSDIIEEQIEEDFNEESEHLSEKDLAEVVGSSEQGKVEMRVLFRVGHKDEAYSDDDNYEVDWEEEESESSDEDSDDL